MPLAVLRGLAGTQTCSQQQRVGTLWTWKRLLVVQRAPLPDSHLGGEH